MPDEQSPSPTQASTSQDQQQQSPPPPPVIPYGMPYPPPPGYPAPYYFPPPDGTHDPNAPPAPFMLQFAPPPPGYVYALPPGYYPPPPMGMPMPPVITKPKRKQVKMACTNCAAACKRCDENRPCDRCQKYGITDTCVDGVRKERKKGVKRGPYKRKRKPEVDSAMGTCFKYLVFDYRR
ncbi:hypothetical protein NEOLEDRAFT_1156614 [Neolentinus lepideus HHB14362 ss-1]|uniref:Transcription activator of gluconeogenesis ERT1 n=1 Tax=Neolentinus lepideus HHB14362 ss-1 TaxID=1314782 RepID=A0A165S9Y0_9AGAM|nr:hypothetical protein NEOLEDRAFT_1156614 [Neolentinus lepideus HHB14362 ss-1]